MLNNNRVKPEHGFAMIEALVTALIVAIGVSGVGVLLMRAIQGTQDSAQLSQTLCGLFKTLLAVCALIPMRQNRTFTL